jgi:hypothetical protein
VFPVRFSTTTFESVASTEARVPSATMLSISRYGTRLTLTAPAIDGRRYGTIGIGDMEPNSDVSP